jgi:Na+-transporting methylmalonyl-CoA/oxaloacetate decarboxylase gamma subunit
LIDWGEAGQIAGIGFGMVVLILGILALVLWLVGIPLKKTAKEEKKEEAKKGG